MNTDNKPTETKDRKSDDSPPCGYSLMFTYIYADVFFTLFLRRSEEIITGTIGPSSHSRVFVDPAILMEIPLAWLSCPGY